MDLLQMLQKIMDAEGLNVTAYAINLVPEKNRNEKGEVEHWDGMYSVFDVPQTMVREGDIKAMEQLVKKQMTERKE